jgi:hypothetical protein
LEFIQAENLISLSVAYQHHRNRLFQMKKRH